MSVSKVSYHAACEVGFQPTIGRTHSCWRFSFFIKNAHEVTGDTQPFGHKTRIYLVTNPHALYGSITLLATIKPYPLHKVLPRHFHGKFSGQYTCRLDDYCVALDYY